MDERLPLVVLVGPTGVGKTEIAIETAERWNGEIVSADSRLLYRGVDIGTAKPTLEQRSRVVHHLIDVAQPDETWSLALFQQEAEKAIATIHARGKLPFLVGGTGQYGRAITEGWAPPRLAPQPEMRAALEDLSRRIGKEVLHSNLATMDAAAAANIDPRNQRRTMRALEVILTTGRKFSDQRQRKVSPYRLLEIGLTRPRTELYRRIDARIAQMLNAGWLDEVRTFLTKGYSADLPSMSAIGYAQLSEHLQGKLSLESAVAEIKKKTRLFVRRQAAWFKTSDPKIHWIDVEQPDYAKKIDALLRRFLKKPPN